jgi:hypothetical protein
MSTWEQQYDDAINNLPSIGDILKPQEGEKAVLHIQKEDGKQIFIFGRVSVPDVVGVDVGWFLHGDDEVTSSGLKCILLPRARSEILKKYGSSNDKVYVESLRVIRPSKSGESLLCEVHKYCEE